MKKFILFFIFFSLKNILFAQAPSANENSLLWKISGNGLRFPSYLYGTIHVIPKKEFFLTDSTLAALNQAESVAFEFNIKKEMSFFSQLRLMTKMRMKGDTTLDMLLDEEDYEFVRRKFATKRLPMKLINRIKPALVTDLANTNMSDLKSSVNTSYEMEFLARAKAKDKKIRGLETAAYQLRVFDSIPYAAQAQMMLEELRNGEESSKKQYKRLLRMYKRQDLQALSKMIEGDSEESAFNNILLYHRNQNWIPVIEKLSKKYRMFYAVGAGHLIGEKGVVALLRKQGFILTPIF